MKKKKIVLQNHGMSRDLSVSKAENTFAWENGNIRITVNDGDTLLSVTNERGTKVIGHTEGSDYASFSSFGSLVGWGTLGDYLILFFSETVYGSPNRDRIFRVRLVGGDDGIEAEVKKIYQGTLGFSRTSPLETVTYYESETIQKIYWVDGVNVLRGCNFMTTYITPADTTVVDTQFDSTKGINASSTISVEISKDNGGATRANGTIQYFITAYNKFGAETGVLYASPLVYLSPLDHGGSADGFNQNKVTLEVSGTYNIGFDYIRTYAILRTSYNGQAAGFIISENAVAASTESTAKVVVVDNGSNYVGSVDASEILFLGCKEFIPSTIQDKDNTLFLGNLTIPSNDFSSLKGAIANTTVSFSLTNGVTLAPNNSLYSYKNQLQYPSSSIKTFKAHETYRFGVVFYKDNGEKSQAFWINDTENTYYPSIDSVTGQVSRPVASVTLNTSAVYYANKLGYTYAQLCIAQATYADREIKAQGILNPTVFNMYNRYNNQPYAMPSWIPRVRNSNIPALHLAPVADTDTTYAELQCAYYSGQTPNPWYAKQNGTVVAETYPVALDMYRDTHLIDTKYTHVYVYATFRHNNFVGDKKYYGNVFVYGCTYTGTGSIPSPFGASPEQRAEYGMVVYKQYPLDTNGANEANFKQNCYRYITYSDDPVVQEYLNLSEGDIDDIIGNLSDNTTVLVPEEADNSWHVNGGVDATISGADGFSKWSRQYYFVDDNIVSFYSPEIEYNKVNLDRNSSIKLRLVGVAPMTSTIADYDLAVSNSRYIGSNVEKQLLSIKKGASMSSAAFKSKFHGIISKPMYYDSTLQYMVDPSDPEYETNVLYRKEGDYIASGSAMYYWIYMWHKTGSIINYNDSSNNTNFASLDSKRFANLYYSFNTNYQSLGFTLNHKDIRQVSGASRGLYELEVEYTNTSPTLYEPTVLYGVNVGDTVIMPPRFKYPVYRTNTEDSSSANPVFDIGSGDPVSIQYKSVDHVVISLAGNTVLPYISDSSSRRSGYDQISYTDLYGGTRLGWNDNYTMSSSSFTQSQWTLNNSIYASSDRPPYMFIAELYDDTITNKYGGTSDTAKQQNIYIPCGERTKLSGTTQTITGKEGDTYYQRYDCVVAKPASENDTNQVFNIASVMLETHVNLDGRTDLDRGPSKLTDVNIENFGNINTAYDQENNFIASTTLDNEKNGLTDYPHTVTWSLEKKKGATTDTWLHQTLASIIDLDGSRGPLNSLKRFNNSLIAFQDRAINELIFNPRVQIQTSDGVPVEISNSGKMEGKRVITEHYGCLNKWSITEGKLGLYFKDDITATINRFNGQSIEPLSTKAKLTAWLKERVTDKVWNPLLFPNVSSYYDPINSDVYFADILPYTETYPTLVFNETLDSFVGLYSYNRIPMLCELSGKIIAYQTTNLHFIHEGFYNEFFGYLKPSSITWRVCPDAFSDKIWTNLEYRADFTTVLDSDGELYYTESELPYGYSPGPYSPDTTFTQVCVWNEYQTTGNYSPSWSGGSSVESYPDSRKKFRIWRTDIKRDVNDTRGLNRIRNPWVFLKVTKTFDATSKKMRMELHDMSVIYYENE